MFNKSVQLCLATGIEMARKPWAQICKCIRSVCSPQHREKSGQPALIATQWFCPSGCIIAVHHPAWAANLNEVVLTRARNAMKAKRSHKPKARATALLPRDVQRRCMHATLNLSNISSVLDGTSTGRARARHNLGMPQASVVRTKWMISLIKR